MRAYVHARKRDYDAAVNDYDEVIKLSPKNAAAYYNRGVALFQLDQPGSGLAGLRSSHKLDPKLVTKEVVEAARKQKRKD